MIIALLYFSQPLILGHGIMNPKDGAFASFFLLSIALGKNMVVASKENESQKSSFSLQIALKSKKNLFRWIVLLVLIIILDRMSGNITSSAILSNGLVWIMSWKPGAAFMESAFFSSGSGYVATYHSVYVDRMIAIINMVYSLFLAVISAFTLCLFLRHANRFYRSIFFAGIALGLTASIRILGPAAGVLIILDWIMKSRLKAVIPPASAYLGIAAAAMFFSWPFLWGNPLLRWGETIQFMSLPWRGEVLFNGSYYSSGALPWNYLITIIPIQLTLPVLILALIGLVTILIHFLKNQQLNTELLLPIIWFFFPMIAWMIIRPTTFDNSRHFLFILAPLFILAALGISNLFQQFHKTSIHFLIGVLVLLPGLIASLILHPYPYTYYNALVGWTPNIYNRFEADYWGTSMCAAAKFLDSKIDSETKIYFTDQNLGILFNRCTRSSPQMMFPQGNNSRNTPEYAVILSRWGYERSILPHLRKVYSLNIGETPLVIIRQHIDK